MASNFESTSQITIYRGAGAVQVANAAATEHKAILLRAVGDTRAPVPWGGLRGFLAQGRTALGDARIERAVSPQRVLLSLALRGLEPSLSEEDRKLRGEVRGLTLCKLPNAVMRDGAMLRAWQGTFGDLFAGERVTILVPELDAIDLESLRALRVVLRALRNQAVLHLVIGHDSTKTSADPVKAFFRARRETELKRLEALPFARVIDAPGTTADHYLEPEISRDPLDDGLEERAYAALDLPGSQKIPNPETHALAVSALTAALDAFAFEPAFRLSEALLSISAPDGFDTREAVRLGAIALYNLAPLAKEPWINDKLVNHFTRLLSPESDPLQRAHWNYRLALVHARGRNSLEAALAAGNAAVAESEAVTGDPRAPLFIAWAHNGRAYVRSRAQDFVSAAADTEAGLAALEGGAAGVPEVEVRLARLLMANNRARVAQMAGDEEGLTKWRAIRTRHSDSMPPEHRPGPLWLPVPGGHRDLAAQRDHHTAVLAEARDRLDVEEEAIAAHGLGVVLYKLGDAHGAHQAFATSLRIWRITGGFAEDVLTEELNTAVTAFRAGETQRATEGFMRVREALADDAASQAETLAALAMIDASAGLQQPAEERAHEAISAAEALGEPEVLVRTLRSAAEAFLMLGDSRSASEILSRALKAIASGEGSGAEFPAEDVLGVLVCHLDACQGRGREALGQALALAPLVVEDANAWWDLPRLAAHLQGHPGLERDPDRGEGLATLAMVVDQRLRCNCEAPANHRAASSEIRSRASEGGERGCYKTLSTGCSLFTDEQLP